MNLENNFVAMIINIDNLAVWIFLIKKYFNFFSRKNNRILDIIIILTDTFPIYFLFNFFLIFYIKNEIEIQ